MKPRDYCCCAIPILNAGIYATLFEQFLLALLVGILAVATPSVVGASVPAIAPWTLFIACMVVAGVQLFGFLGVFKEKAIMYRRYTTIHILSTIAAFSVAAVWIIVSFTRHGTATDKCETDFFPPAGTSSDNAVNTDEQAGILCNIFTWVTAGLMAGLWVVLAIMQLYLYTVVSSYGSGQRRDHEKYNTLYSVQDASDIPLDTNRGDPWDTRVSMDDDDRAPQPQFGRHVRNESDASVSTILAEKPQQPREYGYSDVTYPPQRQPTHASTRRQPSVDDAYVSQPSNAYTQQPAPTPAATGYNYYNDRSYGGSSNYSQPESYGGGYVEYPGRAQAHPAEGSFGRKTPRRQATNGSNFEEGFYGGRPQY